MDEAQAGIKTVGKNTNNLRYADDIALMAESEEELNSLLMKMKQESEKSWLKTQHSKTEIMVWHPNHHCMANRWGNNGNSDKVDFLGLQNHCGWSPQP